MASQQTIEEDSELDISQYNTRLRNPSYKHSLKANIDVDMDNTMMKKVLGSVESQGPSDEEQAQIAEGKSQESEVFKEGTAQPAINMPLQPQANSLITPTDSGLSKEEWRGKNHTHKLDAVFESINKLYNAYDQVSQRLQPLEVAVFDKSDGILPQLQGLANYAKDSDTRVDALIKENASLKDELELVKGLLYKQSKQISALQGKQINQVARSMSDNIVINGIEGDHLDADAMEARALAISFMEEQLEFVPQEQDILVAHWMGQYIKDKNRAIVIKVHPNLKKQILDNTTKLAKKKNEHGKPFSVNVQLPEMLAEQKREIRQIIKEKKEAEKHLDDASKSKILVRNNNVYINGQLQRKLLKPPTVAQLFEIPDSDKEKMDKIKIKYTQTKPLKKSEFLAAACMVSNMNQVHLAYRKLFLQFPGADHIMAGFSCDGKEGYQDDSEFSAGFRILGVIRDSKFTNVAVFIIREYGGLHLGPARFTAIREMAEEALQLIF